MGRAKKKRTGPATRSKLNEEFSEMFAGKPEKWTSCLITDLPVYLPTNRVIIKHSYYLRQVHNSSLTEFNLAKVIAKDLIERWTDISIKLPIFCEKYVTKKVYRLCFQDAQNINWKRAKKCVKKRTQKTLDDLFDISKCSCDLPIVDCDHPLLKCKKKPDCTKKHILCLCKNEDKVITFFL